MPRREWDAIDEQAAREGNAIRQMKRWRVSSSFVAGRSKGSARQVKPAGHKQGWVESLPDVKKIH